MEDQQARPTEDDEETLKALGKLLAADHLLDIIVAHEHETHAVQASDDEAGDDKKGTDGSR